MIKKLLLIAVLLWSPVALCVYDLSKYSHVSTKQETEIVGNGFDLIMAANLPSGRWLSPWQLAQLAAIKKEVEIAKKIEKKQEESELTALEKIILEARGQNYTR